MQKKFIGKLNSLKRHNYILLSLFIEIIFLSYLMVENKPLAVISVMITISIIIYVLLKVDVDKNLLIFNENEIILQRKDSTQVFSYANILKYDFIKQSRGPSFCRLVLINKKIDHVLDTEDGKDFSIEEFAEFIFSKNKFIQITSRKTNFETYKYFKNGDQIRKVLIN